jgi:hypothetical protein
MAKTYCIRTGCQTGVDRAALDFAVRRHIPYGGWCPRGGWAEDHKSDAGLLEKYPRLSETPSKEVEQRTAWNVRDSHATLILIRGDGLRKSAGTLFTQRAAELIFLRPCLIVDMSKPDSVKKAKEWLEQTSKSLNTPELWLNIAGPRASEAPGIYKDVGTFLSKMFP